MNKSKYIISHSPHIHSGESIKKVMYGVIVAMLPLFAFSVYLFGIGAIIVISASVLSCVLFEFLIQKFILKTNIRISDGSAIVTGMLLAFNVPSNLPIWIIVIGALVAIGVGKLSFGGLGNNVFNPALVGRVFMHVSFPVQMTLWPIPKGFQTQYFDAETAATPLAFVKDRIKNKEPISELMSKINLEDMFIGEIPGSLGEMSVILILAGLIFMLWRKIITWHIPISILVTVFLFTEILYQVNPEIYTPSIYHLFGGGLFLGAVFMATDYATSPMSKKGMLVYGIAIGIIAVLIRVFGIYPEGTSFAILIMNAFVPLINIYLKPKRFGEKMVLNK